MSGFCPVIAEQSLITNDLLCSGVAGEKMGRDIAGQERRQGSAIIHAILPIVVAVLGATAVLVVMILGGYLVTRLGRCEVRGGHGCYC